MATTTSTDSNALPADPAEYRRRQARYWREREHLHRAELLHMLGRLGVKNLPEGDLLGWEMDQRKRLQSEVPA